MSPGPGETPFIPYFCRFRPLFRSRLGGLVSTRRPRSISAVTQIQSPLGPSSHGNQLNSTDRRSGPSPVVAASAAVTRVHGILQRLPGLERRRRRRRYGDRLSGPRVASPACRPTVTRVFGSPPSCCAAGPRGSRLSTIYTNAIC